LNPAEASTHKCFPIKKRFLRETLIPAWLKLFSANQRFGSEVENMANPISAETELLPRYATKVEYFRLLRVSYRRGMRLLSRGFLSPVAIVARQPVFAIDQESIQKARAIVRNIP
jgi:hypothetical protein